MTLKKVANNSNKRSSLEFEIWVGPYKIGTLALPCRFPLCVNWRVRFCLSADRGSCSFGEVETQWTERRGECSHVTAAAACGEFSHYGGGVSRADGLSLPLWCLFCVLREGVFIFYFYTFTNNSSITFDPDGSRVNRLSHGGPRRGFVRPAKRG